MKKIESYEDYIKLMRGKKNKKTVEIKLDEENAIELDITPLSSQEVLDANSEASSYLDDMKLRLDAVSVNLEKNAQYIYRAAKKKNTDENFFPSINKVRLLKLPTLNLLADFYKRVEDNFDMGLQSLTEDELEIAKKKLKSGVFLRGLSSVQVHQLLGWMARQSDSTSKSARKSSSDARPVTSLADNG